MGPVSLVGKGLEEVMVWGRHQEEGHSCDRLLEAITYAFSYGGFVFPSHVCLLNVMMCVM